MKKSLTTIAIAICALMAMRAKCQDLSPIQYPIANYRLNCLGWGNSNSQFIMPDGTFGIHLGQDVCASSRTNVMAIADGKIMFARAWKICPNWVYLIIIEHTLSNGGKICSLYGHVKPLDDVKEGSQAKLGETIGEIVKAECWSDHIHFAIYDGPYGTDVGEYPVWAKGYTSRSKWPEKYLEPTRYIQNQKLIGLFTDGTLIPEIRSSYNKHGGQDAFGAPVSISIQGQVVPKTVWVWWQRYVQIFNGGYLNEVAIIFDPDSGATLAFPVQGQLWQYYKANGGPNIMVDGLQLGSPINQESYAIDDATGYILSIQEMANGYLVYNTVDGVTQTRSKADPGFDDDVQDQFIGLSPNGNVTQQIRDCYNRVRKPKVDIGWPVADKNSNGSYFVRYWRVPGNVLLDNRYLIQTFINSKEQESAIMFDTWYGSQAYLIYGDIWEWYSKGGKDGRFGPDILIDGQLNLTVGGPTSDANLNEGGRLFQQFENGYTKYGSVILYANDGTLVQTYEPAGDTSPLELFVRNHTTLDISGGNNADYFLVYEDNIEIGQTTNDFFAFAQRDPGSTHTYRVEAISNQTGLLESSNEVTIVTPGSVEDFTLRGLSEGYSMFFLEWDDVGAQRYGIFVNDVLVAITTFNRRRMGPVAPNTTFKCQIAAMTASNLILEMSNVVAVTTNPAPPPPPLDEARPSRIVLTLPKTSFTFDEDDLYGSATVYDQYGNQMPDERVLYLSDDSSTVVFSADSGSLLFRGIGLVKLWAELYDDRSLKSAMIEVTVSQVVQDDPDVLEAWQPEVSPLQLDQVELLSSPPYIERRGVTARIYYSNQTNETVTYYGPRAIMFRPDGSLADVSGYLGGEHVLNPGESDFRLIDARYFEPGRYTLRFYTNPTGSSDTFDWQFMAETSLEVDNTFYFDVISQDDLRPDLYCFSLSPWAQEFTEGYDIGVRALVADRGQVNITTPFLFTVSLAGRDSQTVEIASMSVPDVFGFNFNFGQLPAGSYLIEAFVDPTNVIAEDNEGDNYLSTIIEIAPAPKLPDLAITSLEPAKSEFKVGEVIQVMGTVVNSGQAQAEECELRLSTVQGELATLQVPALAVDGSFTFSQTLPSLDLGDYQITGTIDAGQSIAESDETNNTAQTSLKVVGLPDLAITSLKSTKRTYLVDEGVRVYGTVINQGQAPAPACQLGLSSGHGNVFVIEPILALEVGESFSFIATMPSPGLGVQKITATVDSGQSIDESDETNNQRQIQVTVIEPLPNLVISKMEVRTYAQYNYLVVTQTNQGETRAGVSTVALDQAGKSTQYRYIYLLEPNQSRLAWFYLGHLKAGSQVVFEATADGRNQVAESDEQDNIEVLFYTVPSIPDGDEVILAESFENGLANWRLTGTGDPYAQATNQLLEGKQPIDGDYVASLGNPQTSSWTYVRLWRFVDLDDYSYAKLEFDICTSQIGYRRVSVRVWDGWRTYANVSHQGSGWQHYEVDLSKYEIVSPTVIMLESWHRATEADNFTYIDNVRLTASR